jgi:hypothetical protein
LIDSTAPAALATADLLMLARARASLVVAEVGAQV